MIRSLPSLSALAALAPLAFSAPLALAQAGFPAVFVANNGNLEGSVSAFALNPDGSPRFLSRYVTGSTPSSSQFDAGTNAYGIALSPDGAVLAVSHATSAGITERLTLLAVAADGSLSLLNTFTTPDSPLDLVWTSDQHLAVTRSNGSVAANNEVILYRYDRAQNTLAQIDREPTGGFTAYLATPPGYSDRLITVESTFNSIRAFRIDPPGQLVQTAATNAPAYPLGPGFSPDAARLYAGGGISAGRFAITGFDVATGGAAIAPHPQIPYFSPGESPKQVVVSADGLFAFVAHGSDATIQSFAIAPADGALTFTGFNFDIGFQGSLGEIAVLGDLLLATDRDTLFDNVRGLISFRIGADGSLTPTGPRVSTQGITPNALAVWTPPTTPACPADWDNSGTADADDIFAYLNGWFAQVGGPGSADLDGSGTVTADDLFEFLARWFQGC